MAGSASASSAPAPERIAAGGAALLCPSLGGALGSRQRERRDGTTRRLVLQRRAAVVQVDDLLDEGQPEPGALLRGRGPCQRIELLEHLALGEIGNPRAVVADHEIGAARMAEDIDRDATARRREVDRVLDQI